jgi:alkylhydroperoxidase family enzyme
MTVRLAPVSGQVAPKEEHIKGKIDTEALSEKEALAVELALRISADPHMVDDDFFGRLKAAYTEEEVVELVWAASFINGANKFNITMRLDTRDDEVYPTNLEYTRLGAK